MLDAYRTFPCYDKDERGAIFAVILQVVKRVIVINFIYFMY